MSQPKKKSSKMRRDQRRYSGHNRMKIAQVAKCAACSEPVRPHRVCKCGQYAGKAVLPARPEASAQA